MLDDILGFWCPGPLELVVICIVFFVVFMIPVGLIILLVIYLVQNSKERRTLRMEVEKLTEEVGKLKQERQ